MRRSRSWRSCSRDTSRSSGSYGAAPGCGACRSSASAAARVRRGPWRQSRVAVPEVVALRTSTAAGAPPPRPPRAAGTHRADAPRAGSWSCPCPPSRSASVHQEQRRREAWRARPRLCMDAVRVENVYGAIKRTAFIVDPACSRSAESRSLKLEISFLFRVGENRQGIERGIPTNPREKIAPFRRRPAATRSTPRGPHSS